MSSRICWNYSVLSMAVVLFKSAPIPSRSCDKHIFSFENPSLLHTQFLGLLVRFGAAIAAALLRSQGEIFSGKTTHSEKLSWDKWHWESDSGYFNQVTFVVSITLILYSCKLKNSFIDWSILSELLATWQQTNSNTQWWQGRKVPGT